MRLRNRKYEKVKDPISFYILANRSGVIFYEESRKVPFHFTFRMTNDEGSKMESEITSDRPGRQASSMGFGNRTALEPQTKKHEVIAQKFAAQIAEVITVAHRTNKFGRLILAAEPHFLGLILQNLRPDLRDILLAVPREYVHGSDLQIRARVHKALGLSAPKLANRFATVSART